MSRDLLTQGFTRADVRRIVKRNYDEIGDAVRIGGNGYQIEIDQQDEIQAMIADWDIDTKNRFLVMHAEEVGACVRETMDRVAETERRTAEINQQSLQQELSNINSYSWVVGLVLIVGMILFLAR
ncbi:hypothetical protein B7H19_09210 [Pseudomonas putida]|uniref:hypothetical protein n=1 Tax=Pseudomonas putida TaxID=303 RepID=UPI000A0F638B|nr:hypothetical protein [Pseudomonas putida]ORL69663.1 hypothetical protein B7H19_09210 [Pseudomonas putida]